MLRDEVEKYLNQVEGWKLSNGSLEKNYKFTNFKKAIEFINRVADIAEIENHHPDILLWNWNNVKLTITTHTIKNLSKKILFLR